MTATHTATATVAAAASAPAAGVGSLKWIEVGVLLAAGIGFFWWQHRDLAKARQASQRQRELEAAQAARSAQDKEPGEGISQAEAADKHRSQTPPADRAPP